MDILAHHRVSNISSRHRHHNTTVEILKQYIMKHCDVIGQTFAHVVC